MANPCHKKAPKFDKNPDKMRKSLKKRRKEYNPELRLRSKKTKKDRPRGHKKQSKGACETVEKNTKTYKKAR